MSKIRGIYAASLSVFNDDLSLNIDKTINHAEKIIDMGCHGVAIFGSTGQAQLISISEKIALLNELSKSKYREKYLIGTGLNSLNETINLMKVASSLNFNDFLIMPPAYYKYGDKEVIELKPDKKSIGGRTELDFVFTPNTIQLLNRTQVFCLSKCQTSQSLT